MKKLLALAVFAVAYAGMLYFSIPEKIELALGDNNKITYSHDIFPITDSLYDLGTTTKAWRTLTVDQVCLTGDSCETTWPAGGSGSLSGGSANTLTYWTSGTGVSATSSPTVGYITATTTSTSSFGGPVTIAKDLEVSVVDSTQAAPRLFGLSALSSGNAARFQFGDYHNALQNAYAQDMNLYSYWALVLTGGRQNYSSGFYPMPFTKYTDVGVLVKSDSYISNDPTGASTTIDTLGIMATTSQWTNLTSWRDPSGTTMSLVDYLGHFSLGTNATSSSVLNVNGLSTLTNASTTHLSASGKSTLTNASTTHMSVSGNSYLGTVKSGTWNGTSITDAYVEDTITASNYLSLSSWFATTSAPHLTTLAGVTSIGTDVATTTAQGNWVADAFGIVGKFFADATQFVVSTLATFTQGVIVQTRLNIPNGAQVYTNNTGDCAFDTTSGQLRCNNGSATTTIGNGFFSQGFTFASSTLDYMGDYGASGTTTIKRAGLEWAYTFNTLYCKSDNTSTSTVIMGNGTASSTVICSPTGNTGTTDITFTARQDAVFQFGNTVGTPNNVLLDVTWSWTND